MIGEVAFGLFVFAMVEGDHIGFHLVDVYRDEQSCGEAADRVPPGLIWECVSAYYRAPRVLSATGPRPRPTHISLAWLPPKL